MSDAIDGARRVIQDRIEEIDLEAASLRVALESLGGSGYRSPATPKARRPKRSGKRAPRGQRREQFLAALKAKPGSRVADVAKEIGISSNQGHALARPLLKDGTISKRAGKLQIAKKRPNSLRALRPRLPPTRPWGRGSGGGVRERLDPQAKLTTHPSSHIQREQSPPNRVAIARSQTQSDGDPDRQTLRGSAPPNGSLSPDPTPRHTMNPPVCRCSAIRHADSSPRWSASPRSNRQNANYWIEAVAEGAEDYYTKPGESPGRWLGSLAAELGLAGEIDRDCLRRRPRRPRPCQRRPAGQPSRSRESSPTPRAASAALEPVLGFDVRFAAPKSVSLLYAVGSPEVRAAVPRPRTARSPRRSPTSSRTPASSHAARAAPASSLAGLPGDGLPPPLLAGRRPGPSHPRPRRQPDPSRLRRALAQPRQPAPPLAALSPG